MDNATDPVHSETVRPSLFLNSSFLASGVDDAYLHFVVLFKQKCKNKMFLTSDTFCSSQLLHLMPAWQHFGPFDLWPPVAPIRENLFLNDFCIALADNA